MPHLLSGAGTLKYPLLKGKLHRKNITTIYKAKMWEKKTNTILIAGVGSIQYLSAYKATAVTIIVSSLYAR